MNRKVLVNRTPNRKQLTRCGAVRCSLQGSTRHATPKNMPIQDLQLMSTKVLSDSNKDSTEKWAEKRILCSPSISIFTVGIVGPVVCIIWLNDQRMHPVVVLLLYRSSPSKWGIGVVLGRVLIRDICISSIERVVEYCRDSQMRHGVGFRTAKNLLQFFEEDRNRWQDLPWDSLRTAFEELFFVNSPDSTFYVFYSSETLV